MFRTFKKTKLPFWSASLSPKSNYEEIEPRNRPVDAKITDEARLEN